MTQIGTGQRRPAEIGTKGVDVAQIRHAETGMAQLGRLEVGTGKIGGGQFGVLQIGSSQQCSAQIRFEQLQAGKIGATEIAARQINPRQIWFASQRFDQLDPLQAAVANLLGDRCGVGSGTRNGVHGQRMLGEARVDARYLSRAYG